jgi:hypothetical protein
MPESPTVPLRAAAELIRKRASRAANEADEDTLVCWETEMIGGQERVIEIRQYPGGTDHDMIAVPAQGDVAEHVAGWHPHVARAVAAWLEFEADALDEGGEPDPASDHALAVARVYLGETEAVSGRG